MFAVDTTEPVITQCPQSQAQLSNTLGSTLGFIVPKAQATDNSGIAPTIQYSTVTPGVIIFDSPASTIFASNVPIGVTIVTVTATDQANNMATCTFTLTVSGESVGWSRNLPDCSHNNNVIIITFIKRRLSSQPILRCYTRTNIREKKYSISNIT